MLETSFALDWLSFTVKGLPDMDVCNALGFGQPYEAWTPVNGIHGYTLCKQHPFGHLVMSNPNRPDMGTHVIMGGSAMSRLSEEKVDTLYLVPWCLKEGAKISRIDLAIDLREQPFDIIAMSRCRQDEVQPGSTRKWNLVTGSDQGVTLYAGSRKSDKFLRVYDKGKQLQIDQLWTRFELEIKGKTAGDVAAALSTMKRRDIPAYVKGVMRGLYNPLFQPYREVIDGDAINVPSTKDTGNRTVEWLCNTVAKTMATQIRLYHDQDILELFLASVRANLNQMGVPDSDQDE